MDNILNLVRNNIRTLKPYSSARDEFKGNGAIFLDANENAFGSPIDKAFNRYPDPLQLKLKQKLSQLKNVAVENIFIGNGSDEPIDLLMRIFCEPGIDRIIINPPTYGMYEVVADVNNVAIKTVNLNAEFQLDVPGILSNVDRLTKLIFVCTPNNPTGNAMRLDDIESLAKNFKGIVVIDEAYIDFSTQKSMMQYLLEYSNLVVLQTFSKAWGLAGLRIGMAFASTQIISLMNKVKFPYNVNEYSQQMALQALENTAQVNAWKEKIIYQRSLLIEQLKSLDIVKNIYPSDANFILVKTTDAKKIYRYLIEKNIVVRDRSSSINCKNCIRITIGTPDENQKLINALNQFTS